MLEGEGSEKRNEIDTQDNIEEQVETYQNIPIEEDKLKEGLSESARNINKENGITKIRSDTRNEDTRKDIHFEVENRKDKHEQINRIPTPNRVKKVIELKEDQIGETSRVKKVIELKRDIQKKERRENQKTDNNKQKPIRKTYPLRNRRAEVKTATLSTNSNKNFKSKIPTLIRKPANGEKQKDLLRPAKPTNLYSKANSWTNDDEMKINQNDDKMKINQNDDNMEINENGEKMENNQRCVNKDDLKICENVKTDEIEENRRYVDEPSRYQSDDQSWNQPTAFQPLNVVNNLTPYFSGFQEAQVHLPFCTWYWVVYHPIISFQPYFMIY